MDAEARNRTVELRSIAKDIDRFFDQEVLPTLSQYVCIECLSPAFDESWREHGELHRAVQLLSEWVRAQELENATIEVVELDGRTPLIFVEIEATSPGAFEAATLIYGHCDKQPPLAEWREGLQPFQMTVEGDRLYGRGTADDGYAIFAACAAVRSLQIHQLPHGRIVILIEASEESGSPDLDAYVSNLADRIGDIKLVVCLDSGCATYDRLWMTTSLRGLVTGELRVDVLTEGVHSGQAGGIVPSSFRISRELLSRIEDENTGAVTLADLVVTMPPIRRDEIALIAEEYGYEAAGLFPTTAHLELDGSTPAERIEGGTWRPALEIIGGDGLPTIADAGNVLRPWTALKLAMRIPPTCNATRAAQAIAQTLCTEPPSGATISFRVEQTAEGWEAPALETWLSDAVNEASGELFGASTRSMGVGGSIPFMSALSIRFPDAQFIVTGVLGPESNAHGPNEFLHLPTAKSVSAAVAHVISAAFVH